MQVWLQWQGKQIRKSDKKNSGTTNSNSQLVYSCAFDGGNSRINTETNSEKWLTNNNKDGNNKGSNKDNVNNNKRSY